MPGTTMRVIAAAAFAGLAACATLSAQSRIENRLMDLGLSESRAECLAGELADTLDRRDLKDVADFLDRLDRADTPRGVVETLRRIDNPRAAATVAAAAIACALSG
ncbi:hypothetical protein [Amphiplicatus metriothermophilus]|uniref:Lipoprotein n=1 Tax=Amphiplicatus metriothermophilus TaxID=1519374 RepID=A0A239PLR2_9PROT|nr:hypothetical protein [Amphiplicatus metriothermophilus]MBB5517382.1 hypothetical protein [Amphiplicatus metriothermophilus]SNT68283.1 hypothetical protein SAMN06297382_0784 [Amphiplicatus metriothermophilus]